MDEQSWVISRVQCDEVENNTCKVKTERDCLKLKIESQAKRIAELENVVEKARPIAMRGHASHCCHGIRDLQKAIAAQDKGEK